MWPTFSTWTAYPLPGRLPGDAWLFVLLKAIVPAQIKPALHRTRH